MIQVVITLNDQGQLQVAGSTQNPVELYGLLGMAADAIGEQSRATAAQAQQRIQLAPAGIFGNLKT